MNYGDKRNYPKIDIYTVDLRGNRIYECSTTWAKSCKYAKERFLLRYPFLSPNQVVCKFAKNS